MGNSLNLKDTVSVPDTITGKYPFRLNNYSVSM